jgi:hypothetical protein
MLRPLATGGQIYFFCIRFSVEPIDPEFIPALMNLIDRWSQSPRLRLREDANRINISYRVNLTPSSPTIDTNPPTQLICRGTRRMVDKHRHLCR